MSNTIATYIWTNARGKMRTKNVKALKTLITVRDSHNRIIVRVYRPKSVIALSYHKVLELLKIK